MAKKLSDSVRVIQHVYNTQLTETTMFSSFLLRDSLSDEEIVARLRAMRSVNASKVAAYYELLANADQLGKVILSRHQPRIVAFGVECPVCIYDDIYPEQWPCPELLNIFGFLECE